MKFVGITLLATGLFSLPALAAGIRPPVGESRRLRGVPRRAGQGDGADVPESGRADAMYLQHALQAYKGAQRRPSRGDEGLCVGAVG